MKHNPSVSRQAAGTGVLLATAGTFRAEALQAGHAGTLKRGAEHDGAGLVSQAARRWVRGLQAGRRVQRGRQAGGQAGRRAGQASGRLLALSMRSRRFLGTGAAAPKELRCPAMALTAE